jgi:hypothetical protein
MTSMLRFIAMLVMLVLGIASSAAAPSAVAQDSTTQTGQDQSSVTWTVTIPEGFPGKVFTWRLKPDGTYEEDGRDQGSGRSIQPTLFGRWTIDGDRMVLRQEGFTYVFDGVVAGDRYSGTLYFGLRRMSRFCAIKGQAVPQHCDLGVASLLPATGGLR